MSEIEIFKSIYDDWVEFIQQTLVGHWVIYLVVLLDMIVTIIVAVVSTKIIAIAKPLSKWKVWGIWLLGGLWGAHWLCFNPEETDPLYPKYDTGPIDNWCGFSAFSVIGIMALLTFHLFDAQYHVVAVLLMVLIFSNLIFGFFRIPYSVKKFNAHWYRRYVETDLMLKNRRLPVDDHLKEINQRMTEFGENLKIVNAIIDNSNYGKGDADTSFFKNLFTFGNYNKLQREKGRLNLLEETCNALDEEIEKNSVLQMVQEDYLEQYRAAAYRNINLCKDLLGLLKKLEGKRQSIVSDKSIYIPQLSNVNITAMINMKNVEFNTAVFGECTASSIESVGDTLNAIQKKGEKVTSADLAVGALEIGLSAVVDGISGIIDLNTETTNQRGLVQHHIAEVTSQLETLVPKLNTYKAEVLRQVELLVALKEMCIAFIKVYEPLRKSVYDDKGGLKDGYQKFIMQPETRKQLGLLAAICSNYSKVNNAKR